MNGRRTRLTPVSAAMGRKGSVLRTSKISMPVRLKLPRTMPKSSSPSTAGMMEPDRYDVPAREV